MTSRAIEILTDLTADAFRALARKEKNQRAAKRMRGIAHELDGYDREEAARLADMSDQALRDAIKRLNSEGVDGLYDRPRSGRPRHLDEKQDAEIKAAVLAGPDIEAHGLSSFTLEDIRAMIAERHGAAYHIGYMGRVMKRLGVSRQKTRPSHPQKDPVAAAAFKKRSTKVAQDCSYTRKAG